MSQATALPLTLYPTPGANDIDTLTGLAFIQPPSQSQSDIYHIQQMLTVANQVVSVYISFSLAMPAHRVKWNILNYFRSELLDS